MRVISQTLQNGIHVPEGSQSRAQWWRPRLAARVVGARHGRPESAGPPMHRVFTKQEGGSRSLHVARCKLVARALASVTALTSHYPTSLADRARPTSRKLSLISFALMFPPYARPIYFADFGSLCFSALGLDCMSRTALLLRRVQFS